MPTTKEITTTAEVSLNDFDVNEIIEYLQSIHITKDEYDRLYNVLRKNKVLVRLSDAEPEYMFDNLADQFKFETCLEAMKKYSQEELQKRLL